MNRLRLHEVVLVAVPHGLRDGLLATVLAFSERGMTLQAMDKERVLRLRDANPDSFVTFRHEKALVALPGTVYRLKPIGDLRFQVSERGFYRTRGTRVNYEMPVTVGGSSGVESEGATVNIGPDGVLIECALETLVGERVTVSFVAPQSNRLVSGAAEVVRAAEGLVAVHLRPDSTEVRNALGNIVVAVSRAELTREVVGSEVGPDF